MPFIPQQPQSGLDTEGLRKHGEEQFREVARAWTEVDKAIVDAGAALTSGLALKVAKAGDTMTGTLNIGPFAGTKIRLNDGTYGTQLYNDGANFYFLTTNAGDPLGGFNGLRPFNFSQSTGNVSMAHAVSIGGATTIGGTLDTTGQYTTAHRPEIIQQAGAASTIMVWGTGSHAAMSFHAEGYFGANFGMANDGNFYMGGWSHGLGTVYKFWTTRDFGGAPVTDGRVAYGVDSGLPGVNAYYDVVANAVVTGFYMNPSGFLIGFRCRYVQGLRSGAWFTFPFA